MKQWLVVAYLKASPRLLVPVLTPTCLSCTIAKEYGFWSVAEIQVSLISSGAGSTCLDVRGGRRVHSPPNPRIFARTRGSCGPFLGGKSTNVGGERGDFMDRAQAYTRKRRIHATRGVFSCIIKCEDWSLLSIDRSISAMDSLNQGGFLPISEVFIM